MSARSKRAFLPRSAARSSKTEGLAASSGSGGIKSVFATYSRLKYAQWDLIGRRDASRRGLWKKSGPHGGETVALNRLLLTQERGKTRTFGNQEKIGRM